MTTTLRIAVTAALVAMFSAPSAHAQTFDHLKCFKAKASAKQFKRATADITILSGHFAGTQNCTISAGPKEFCVMVDKDNVVFDGEGTVFPFPAQSLQFDQLCYKVKCAKQEFGPKAFQNQFGTRTTEKFKVSKFCVPATKDDLPECGNGIPEIGEECDDGGESATCDADCTNAECGDGTLNVTAGETCDDGGESASCDPDCTSVVCGDGYVNMTAGEECEDGGAVPGDGCDASCQCEPVCVGVPGCQCAQCPDRGEVVIYAATRGTSCSSNMDCDVDGVPVGECDTGLGKCVTDTRLDSGHTGLGHGSDINDAVLNEGFLLCDNPFPAGIGEPCGECSVLGINPINTHQCRCNFNNQQVCNANPFELDDTDCDTGLVCVTNSDCQRCSVTGGACLINSDCPLAGTNEEVCMNGFRRPTCENNQCIGTCDCFFGPPLPLSAGGTSACVLNKFREDVSGTANPDLGEGEITTKLFARVFLPQNAVTPCPFCEGDTTPNDGVRDGTCVGDLGRNEGRPCDVMADNESFPADTGGGGGHSLDCIPGVGQNVSGEGIVIDLVQTTGAAPDLNAGIPCGFIFDPQVCPCSVCQGSLEVACQNNGDCVGTCDDGQCTNLPGQSGECTTNADCDFMNCAALGNGNPLATACPAGETCDPVGDGTNECSLFDSKFCDGVLFANGDPIITCTNDAQCAMKDCGAVSCGLCSITKNRKCFPDPITASGTPSPNNPIAAATFCIPPTQNTGINSAAGLPGPGRVLNQVRSRTFCASMPSMEYDPGVGGCP